MRRMALVIEEERERRNAMVSCRAIRSRVAPVSSTMFRGSIDVWASGTWIAVAQQIAPPHVIDAWVAAHERHWQRQLANAWYCRYDIVSRRVIIVDHTGRERWVRPQWRRTIAEAER